MRNPAVSIICAAYNRADILRYAIQSVLQSDFPDWELIVVGDACTDDTEAVVGAFADPRISFENLAVNSGGQAAPNNRGLEKARGRTILFLNQDDMYMQGHIGESLRFLEESGADVVWSPMVVVEKTGRPAGPPDPACDSLVVAGVTETGAFDPEVFVVASSWAMKRETCEKVGPWRSERECRVTPSQEWLFRAASTGARIVCRDRPSVLCIYAGQRHLSYRRSSDQEHARAWSRLEKGLHEREVLAASAVNLARRMRRAEKTAAGEREQRIRGFAETFGVNPVELRLFLEGVQAGEIVDRWRRSSFRAEPLAPGTIVAAGARTAGPYFAGGWHPPEGPHRWSALPQAELIFAAVDCGPAVALRLKASTLLRMSPIRVLVDGEPVAARQGEDSDDIVVPLGRPRDATRVILEVDRCITPLSLDINEDQRELGVMLAEFEIVPDAPPA